MRHGDRESGPPPPTDDGDRVEVIEQVVERSSRFSKQFVATMISLASAAFGVVAALAWNEAVTATFRKYFGENTEGEISALFVYAVIVTVIGVLVIVLLGRLAARLEVEPVEFKYPAPPRT